jgi:hypothetical protein
MFDKQDTRTGSISVGYPVSSQLGPTTPQAPSDVGQVTAEGHQLDKALAALSDEIGTLEARISMVLRPAPPSVDGNGAGVPTALRCQIADGLAEANRRVAWMVQFVRSLRERVDL